MRWGLFVFCNTDNVNAALLMHIPLLHEITYVLKYYFSVVKLGVIIVLIIASIILVVKLVQGEANGEDIKEFLKILLRKE